MRLKYADKHYAKLLFVDHCEAFIQICNTRIAQDSILEDCQEAMLLQQMQLPASHSLLSAHSFLRPTPFVKASTSEVM